MKLRLRLNKNVSHWLFGLLFLVAACTSHANFWRSNWWGPWYQIMALVTLGAAWQLRARFHWSAVVLFAVLALSALRGFCDKELYATLPPDLKPLDMISALGLSKICAYTFGTIVLFGSFFARLESAWYPRLGQTFAALCLLNSSTALTQIAYYGITIKRSGLFGNSSMSACITAITFPFLLHEIRRVSSRWSMAIFLAKCTGTLIPAASIVLSAASVPMGVLILVVASYLRKRRELLSMLPLLAGAGFYVLWLSSGFDGNANGQRTIENVFSSSGRLATWELVLTWWWEHGNLWLGQCTGISQGLVPMLQQRYSPNPPDNWWLWFHSDILQTLFENGIVGLLSLLTAYAYALVKSYSRPTLFAALIGLGATASLNYPAHLAHSAFIATAVLAMALHKELVWTE
jgi:hypothetical protein